MKTNKDGTKTLEWLREREEYLIKKYPSVQWYIKFNKQLPTFKQELIAKYNKYLKESQNSKAHDIYFEMKEAIENNDKSLIKQLTSKSREMLANGDFKQAPALYDPQYIESDFFVSQYLSIKSDIAKQTDGFNMEDLSAALI